MFVVELYEAFIIMYRGHSVNTSEARCNILKIGYDLVRLVGRKTRRYKGMRERAAVRFSNNGSAYVDAKELVCSKAFKQNIAELEEFSKAIRKANANREAKKSKDC